MIVFYTCICWFLSPGGVFFGYAENMDGDIPANTVLGIMVKCLFTGKKFLAKLIPCACLTSEFQFDVISKLVYQLEECGGKVLACINDNNKVNQSYFGLFPNISNRDASQMCPIWRPIHMTTFPPLWLNTFSYKLQKQLVDRKKIFDLLQTHTSSQSWAC